MLKTIRLYGVLGAKFGRVHKLAVDSTAEAIKALSVIKPGFKDFLSHSKKMGLEYAIFLGDRNIGQDDLRMNSGASEIRIAPMMVGSKKAGMFQTILGAVMVVVGVLISYFSAGTMSAFGMQLAIGGGALMAGGVMQMLSPQPGGLTMSQDADNKPNYAFGSPVNSTAAGGVIGVLYGEREIGGTIISGSIVANEIRN